MALLRVHITCDADQDGSTGLVPERTHPTWEGIALLPAIARELSARGLPWTAFVRADDQVRDTHGSSGAILERARDLLADRGVEIGWHPHLYSRQGDEYAPIRDEQAAVSQLDRVHDEICRKAAPLRSVRLGEAWHSPRTMLRLAELGYRVDSTALPGRKRRDAQLEFDWEPTPNQPYHPAASDPRVPGSGQDRLPILEVPMTTCAMRTDYDRGAVRRYLSLSFHERYFVAGLDDFDAQIESAREATLVTIFHTGELLDLGPTPLLDRGWDAWRRNLDRLIATLDSRGHALSFQLLREAAT